MSILDPGSNLLLESDLLRTFVEIAEAGSFTRAAGRVHRTPSAVSMQVKRLEEALGRALFVREGRAVRLTPDGEALLGYGRRLIGLNAEAVAHFRRPLIEGVVRLGTPDEFGTHFVPEVLKRFAATHPSVEISLSFGASVDLLAEIEAGDLDLALTIEPGDPPGEPLFNDRLVWAGLEGGSAWRQDVLPLALANPTCSWRRHALGALDRAGRRYRVACTSTHSMGQLSAVLADLAVAPVPANLAGPPFRRLGAEHGLPDIMGYTLYLQRARDPSCAAEALARHVLANVG